MITAGTSLGGSAANFAVSPASAPGQTYTLVHDASAKTLTLNVAAAGAVTYQWIGSATSDWDIGTTANWSNAPGALVVYADASDVVFNANGSAFPTVNIPGTVSPSSATVSAATDYTFSGTGKISGTGGLSKSGAGKLTISTANDYTGATSLDSGTVNLNATETPGTSGPLGKNNTISLLGATLQYSAANTADYSSRFNPSGAQTVNIDTAGQNVTFATALPSAATLSKVGNGTLTLSASNNISGLATVSAGTLALTATNTFAGGLTVSGGILDLGNIPGGVNQAAGPVTISGGTITNGSLLGSSYAGQSGTVAAKLAGQNIPLTKTTSGTLVLSTNNTCGLITVNAGILAITGSQTNTGAGGIAVDGGILTNSGSINIGTAAMYAGNAAASKGVINIGAGTVVPAKFEAGLVAGASGALNISGGNFTTTQGTVDDANFRVGKVGYGAFTLSGGTVTVQRFQSQGGTGATGISLVSGGTLNVIENLIIGRNGAAGGQGVLTVSGGTVNHAAAAAAINVGNASGVRGELNLTGGTINNTGQTVSFGAGSGTATGIVNLNAGLLIANGFLVTDGANAVNLNGATLQSSLT
ncbi:MAG: autotransporter-associated beta strand repeat-containing protein, partial [Verrucomicrobia bacterium]|nr:autotransporter-associated beta strand repeat-containing protein [Verrucomicrobiota bacterium]